jgi:HAD superfamily hydrolase (TIGR01509 family)
VLFDVGGVLVEVSGGDALLGWLDHRMTVQQFWSSWLHSPSVRAFETGRIDADQFADALLTELQIKVDAAHFLDLFTRWPSGLFPGTLEMIRRIPPRYQRALLSNSNVLHWGRVVDEMGLGALFEHRFASHLTGKIKPDAEAFEHALAALGYPTSQVFYLDDNALNVEAARRIGMRAEQVRGAAQAQQALQRAGIITAS